MNSDIILGGASIPAILGLVEACKSAGLPTRYAPLVAVAIGILASVAGVYANQYPWIPAVAVGVSLGLAACGLYSGAKTVARGNAASARTPAPAAPPTA